MFHHFHLTLLLRIMKMVGQCIQYILVPAISGASIVTSSLSLSVSQLLKMNSVSKLHVTQYKFKYFTYLILMNSRVEWQ